MGVPEEARSYSQGAAPCSRQGRRGGARGFQKRLPMRVAKLKEAYPTAKVELWTEDEHRLGLKPVLRKVWSRKGERPTVSRSISATNGPTSTLLSLGRTLERSTGSFCRRQTWRCSRWPSNTSQRKSEQARREGASSWCSIEPDGTRARRLGSRRAFTLSSCHRTLRSYSPPKGYGHLATREWQTATSRSSKSSRRR